MNYLLVAVAYLLGTLPSAQLVAGRSGVDPTSAGSGNPGATNVYRTAGRRAGLVVFAADVGKGIAAVALGMAVAGRPLALACWVAATVGHVLPVTRRFRGGKGVATGGGGSIVLFPVLAELLWKTQFLTSAIVRSSAIPPPAEGPADTSRTWFSAHKVRVAVRWELLW